MWAIDPDGSGELSATECCTVLDLADLPECEERQEQLRRVGAMLWRMASR